MTQSPNQKSHYEPSLVGGLDTRYPPHRLESGMSPDLQNVLLSKMGVEKRGGFIPLIRQQPNMNAVVNKGYHTEGQYLTAASTPSNVNVDYLTVPGLGIAGDRLDYSDLAEYTLDFFFRPDDLTSEHGGNGQFALEVNNPFPDSPFTLRVRPILSKGPLKKSLSQVAPHQSSGPASTPALMDWDSGVPYGPATTVDPTPNYSGMPFCVYLYNSGTASVPVWKFRLSVHGKKAANFELHTVEHTISPEVGTTYHIIASIDFGTSLRLRIGITEGGSDFKTAYTTVSKSLIGVTQTVGSAGPIQVFDCPQPFIEDLGGNVPTTTYTSVLWTGTQSIPPGLNLAVATDGGYWFASKRAEGAIEDIVIWRTVMSADSDTTFDRSTKLALTFVDKADLLNYWSFNQEGEGFVEEATGRGNHLYLAPDGPLYDDISGGQHSDTAASWWFNGTTSYALARLDDARRHKADIDNLPESDQLGNTNWRYRDTDKWWAGVARPRTNFYGTTTETLVNGWLEDAVKKDLSYGIQVDFIPDSLAENFEQVLMEIHSVLRLTIGTDGKLRGWARDGSVVSAGVGLTAPTPLYDDPVGGTDAVVPGNRYSVVLLREATTVKLIVNGVVDATISVAALGGQEASWPISGITIGMGAHSFTSLTKVALPAGGVEPIQADQFTAGLEQINVDNRSGFVGRIEVAKIVCGDSSFYQRLADQGDDDAKGRVETVKLWSNPGALFGGYQTQHPFRASDTSVELGTGFALGVTPDESVANKRARYASADSFGTSVFADWMQAYDGGHTGHRVTGVVDQSQERVRSLFYYEVGRWVFNKNDRDELSSGRYQSSVEHRVSGIFPVLAQGPDTTRAVYSRDSLVTDVLEALGDLESRCIESDLIIEKDAPLATPGNGAAVILHGITPYLFQSPEELKPSHGPGLVKAASGGNPISLIADWHHQPSSERFMITAAGRNIYWAKSAWRHESPFLRDGESRCIWTFGQLNDYVRVLGTNAEQAYRNATDTAIVVDFWCKPIAVDGFRVMCAKGNDVDGWNYVLAVEDGSLTIGGTFGASGAWLFQQARTDAGGNEMLLQSALKINQWNHVQVYIGALGVGPTLVAHINGEIVLLNRYRTGGVLIDNLNAGTPDSQSKELSLLGLPIGSKVMTFAGTAVTATFTAQSWKGSLTEFRQRVSELGSTLPTDSIMERTQRHVDDSSTWTLLHLNKGSGHAFASDCANLGFTFGAESRITELIHVGSTEDESTDFRYEVVVFRDNLYITNGLSRPKELRFRRYSHPDGPFSFNHVGMKSERGKRRNRVVIERLYSPDESVDPAVESALAAGARNTDRLVASRREFGVYEIYCSFVDVKGRESEPMLIGTETYTAHFTFTINGGTKSPAADRETVFTIAAGALPRVATFNVELVNMMQVGPIGLPEANGGWRATRISPTSFSIDLDTSLLLDPVSGDVTVFHDGYTVKELPRSPDPQVIARKLYISRTGGGIASEHSIIEDNDSDEADLYGDPPEGTPTRIFGSKLTAPRARLIDVGAGRLFMAHIPTIEIGGSTIEWSDGAEPSYFNVLQQAAVDSKDGKDITNIVAHLGRLQISKRDSLWQLSLNNIPTTIWDIDAFLGALTVINQSVGLGGGSTVYDNVIFGAGEKGVYRSDFANVAYAGEALQGEWVDIPRTDDDFLHMFGAYRLEESQYWLSLRTEARAFATRIYVLHQEVGDRQAWTRLVAPEHSYLVSLLNPVDQRPLMVLGTTSGQILHYTDDVFIDGHDGLAAGSTSVALLTGTSSFMTTTTLTFGAGGFDGIGSRLRGLQLVMSYLTTGSVPVVEVRRITFSDDDTLYWDKPIATPLTPAIFSIGGYEAFWTSRWIAPQGAFDFQKVSGIDFDFEPTDATLTVSHIAAITKADKTTVIKPTRAFPGGATTQNLDTTPGIQSEPLRTHKTNYGKYFRVRIGTSEATLTGTKNPWRVSGWGYRWLATGKEAGRAR